MSPTAKLRVANPRFFSRICPFWRAHFRGFDLRAHWSVCAHIWRAARYYWGKTIFGVITHPHPYPRPPGRGGAGLSESENVDPNRKFQNSDLSIVMVSGTSCVVYGTHKPSRRHLSAVEGLERGGQGRIQLDQITE